MADLFNELSIVAKSMGVVWRITRIKAELIVCTSLVDDLFVLEKLIVSTVTCMHDQSTVDCMHD
jgi:hypothetical protein